MNRKGFRIGNLLIFGLSKYFEFLSSLSSIIDNIQCNFELEFLESKIPYRSQCTSEDFSSELFNFSKSYLIFMKIGIFSGCMRAGTSYFTIQKATVNVQMAKIAPITFPK